ncbi:type IV toxin-antitoxin system AbiEi family antitoxin domain-containing protein [Cupriavidus basilensis]|uniref:type IV toxin-antitoxin system AbiEi family antitoxin domain-containing protein n=1 Tax=Cupriavidus basilensis TaxID=68895 RepID=UPI0007C86209|nr:type IV toxin-antitoxin system AbiEi family antitoxin domain-containing protein [Cupriavidus basilensis]
MEPVSSPPGELARKNLTVSLHHIARTGQNRIAEEIGVSAPTISRFCSEGDLERACKVLAAAGIKCVPIEFQCFPKDTVAAFMQLARERMNELQNVDQLSWE